MRLGEAPDMSLPVLLSVRKVPGGPPGLPDVPGNSSYSGLPDRHRQAESVVPPGPPSLPIAAAPTSSKKRSFFRIFHRSATLLFQHPTTELNPNKPYKGSISLSTKDLRNGPRYTKSPSGGGGGGPGSLPASSSAHQRPVPGPQTMGGGYAKRQQVPPTAATRPAGTRGGYRMRGPPGGPHSMPYNPGPLPSPPGCVGGSSSSLNSSVLHHNLENDASCHLMAAKDSSDSEHGGTQGSSSSGVESADSKLIQMRMMQHPILQQVR